MPRDTHVIAKVWLALIIVYSIVTLVGIWRSASFYRQQHPDKNWGGLAKVAVVLGALSGLAGLARSFTENDLDFAKGNTADDRLQLQATLAALNKDLPKQIDASTRLDRIGIEGDGVVYYHTFSEAIRDLSVFQAT